MITIYDIEGRKIERSDVIKNLIVTRDCLHVEELMKSDYVRLSWKDAKKYILPVGTYIIPFPEQNNPLGGNDERYPIKYRLYEPYNPEQRNETENTYEPEFQHPIMWLDRLPIFLITGDVTDWSSALKKTSWGYTGSPQHIAGLVVDCINWLAQNYEEFRSEIGNGWTAAVDTDLLPTVTVNFESVSIYSAASLIAQACDCEFHFDYARKQFRLGTIKYGTQITLRSGENVGVASVSRTKKDYYNSFLVKGSTRNLSKSTNTGENVQVTERLMLDPMKYPDGVMYVDDKGNIISRAQFLTLGVPSFMQELIFDDIYPKLELYLYNIRERKCWLLDSETGKKIADNNGELNPEDGKRYKAYSKWYIRLAAPVCSVDAGGNRIVSEWVDYKATPDKIIDGQTLMMSFLANTETDAELTPLLGQGEFELVYFDKQTHEQEDDDIDPAGFTAEEGDYRIVFHQTDTLIIPTTSSGGIYPKGGQTPDLKNNKAALIGVVIDEVYKSEAQSELEMVAKRKVALLSTDLNNYVLPSNPDWFEQNEPQIHIGQSVLYDDGQNLVGEESYQLDTHVIKIETQLDYPFVQEITVGNEKVKSQITSLQDTVQTLITGGASGGESAGSLDESQVDSLIRNYGSRYFLSRTNNDTANGEIGFLQGLWIKVKGLFGFDAEGNLSANEGNFSGRVTANILRSDNYSGDEIADTGWRITNANNGHSKLTIDEIYVRMKAVFESLEVKRWTVSAGDEIRSCAANIINRTEYLDSSGEAVGYSDMRVPWMMRGIPFLLSKFSGTAARKMFAAIRKVRVNLTPEQLSQVKTVRCYFLANDGDTEIQNWWDKDDLVRCQTMNVVNTTRQTYTGTTTHAGNVFWWRKCKGVSSSPIELEQGKKYHYIDIAYDKAAEDAQSASIYCMLGSDIPAAGDHMVQFGNTVIPGRMNLWIQMVNGGGSYDYDPSSDAPCIKGFKGIYTFDLSKSWFGGNPCKMTLAPGKKYEFFGEDFRVVKEYGTVPVPTNRGLWTSITPERDDYTPHANVRKCYYYDEVSHNGCMWRCSIADGAHWVDASGNYITDAAYDALTNEQKVTCTRKPNYTTDEPSANSANWIKIVDRGTSVKSVTTEYAKSNQGTTPPSSGWVSSISSLSLSEGDYLWTKTVTTYSDTLTPSTTYTVSRWGIDGDGISSINVSFAESATLYSLPSQESRLTWYDNFSSLPLTLGDYIYTRYTIRYDKKSTPTVSYTVNKLGEDGVGYVGTEEYYALSSSNTTAPSGHPYSGSGAYKKYTAAQWRNVTITGGWSEQMPTYQGDANKYLWNFEVSFDTDGNAMVTKPICIGNFAKGITSIVETYTISKHPLKANMLADTTERNAHPWTDEVYDSAPTDSLPYQWNKTVTSYSDGTADTFYHISAVKGTAGRGISTIAFTYARSESNEKKADGSPKTIDGGWGANMPLLTSVYKYMWRKTVITYTDGNTDTVYEIMSEHGEKGPTIRGPREWKGGTQYYQGAEGEEFIDLVVYNSAFYRCKVTNSSSTFKSSEWEAATWFDFIATDVFFAEYSKINNLWVDKVEMYTSGHDGEESYILFRVKDGNVLAKTGTFENVKVTGEIHATSGSFKGTMTTLDETVNTFTNQGSTTDYYAKRGVEIKYNKNRSSVAQLISTEWGNGASGMLSLETRKTSNDGLNSTTNIYPGSINLYSGTTADVSTETVQITHDSYGGYISLANKSLAGGANLTIKGNGSISGDIAFPNCIKTSSFTLPANPLDGMIFFCKGISSALTVTTKGHAIMERNGNGNWCGTYSSETISDRDSVILVFSGTAGKWIYFSCE